MSSSTAATLSRLNKAAVVQPRCDTPDSRTAAYSLLAELARDCPQNLKRITSAIATMHHSFDQGKRRIHPDIGHSHVLARPMLHLPVALNPKELAGVMSMPQKQLRRAKVPILPSLKLSLLLKT